MLSRTIMTTERPSKFYVTERAATCFANHHLEPGDPKISAQTRINDAARELADRLDAALLQGRISDVTDSDAPNELTRLALIPSQRDRKCYVILRHHRPSLGPVLVGPSGSGGFATVTIVSERTGAQNVINGTWKLLNRPFAKLADLPPPTPGVATALDMALEQSDKERRTPPAPVVQHDVAAPPAPDNARRAAMRSLPDGWQGRKAREERIKFAREITSKRPHIKIGGRDGLHALLKDQFGVALDDEILNEIIDEAQAAAAATAPTPAPRPAPIPPPAPPAVSATAAKIAAIAQAFAEATEREHVAKAVLASNEAALLNAQANRDGAAELVANARRECDRLLAALQAARA